MVLIRTPCKLGLSREKMSPLIPLTIISSQVHMAFGALLNLSVAHFSKVSKMYFGITHLDYLRSAYSELCSSVLGRSYLGCKMNELECLLKKNIGMLAQHIAVYANSSISSPCRGMLMWSLAGGTILFDCKWAKAPIGSCCVSLCALEMCTL